MATAHSQLYDERDRYHDPRALLSSVLETASDAILVLDRGGSIRTWNRAASLLLGEPVRESSAFFPEASIAKALNGETSEWSGPIQRADGASLSLECSLTPVRGADGAVTALLARARDLTALRTANRELTVASERLRMVQRAVKAGVWEIDVTTGLLYRSPELAELYGIPGDNAVKPESEWTRFVHTSDAARVKAAIQEAIGARSELRLQYRASTAEGGLRWLTAIGRVVEGTGPLRMVGITIDTTDFQKAEESVREASRLDSIGRLAGGVAHDFNNLLAGIMGAASFIAETVEESHPSRPMLDLIVRTSERAAHLTQQLLAYSGKASYFLRNSSLSAIVQDTLPLLRGLAPPNIHVAVQAEQELPRVQADANQIRELVINLVTNSVEAIGTASGSVAVRVGIERRKEPYVYLEVQDNGPGIEPSLLGRVFEPFFTTKFTGRGLGLSAVQGIVRAHNGTIDVVSEPGRGAAFRALFPAVREAAESQAATPAARATVLVIDDEEAVRSIVRAKLERSGYRVLMAEDGAAGFDLYRQMNGAVDLVILDIAMPGMSGPEIFTTLRGAGDAVPVILTSGYPQTEALARLGGRSVDAFLQKPFRVTELIALVEKLTCARPAAIS